ncbi:MAG: DNA polymerase IV [Patescibacteria group bacterium]|nr:DNA polymerase IV [Patescibacteria group bacterium]
MNSKKVILHIDSDAFFAACEKAVNPSLKNKPLVVGLERGIVTSACYFAKQLGVDRGMRIKEVREKFPQVMICHSNYPLYRLISKKMFEILNQFTDSVEEYSIDEAFLDITDLGYLMNLSYEKIGYLIQRRISKEVDISVSVGISLSKVLAKIASKYQKPKGLTFIPQEKIDFYLSQTSVEKVWGIGSSTARKMSLLGIRTAFDFAKKSETWVKKYFHKPQLEIWYELKGESVLPLVTEEKLKKSITRSYTFYPLTNKFEILTSHLFHNLNLAFFQLRSYHQLTKKIIIFLKTSDFHYQSIEIELPKPTAYLLEVKDLIIQSLKRIFNQQQSYRATGVVLCKLSNHSYQMSFFEDQMKNQRLEKLYQGVDLIYKKYGREKLLNGVELLTKKKEKKIVFNWPVLALKI